MSLQVYVFKEDGKAAEVISVSILYYLFSTQWQNKKIEQLQP